MEPEAQQSLEEEMQYSEEYASWLMATYPERIHTKDDLLLAQEQSYRFDTFLATLPGDAL